MLINPYSYNKKFSDENEIHEMKKDLEREMNTAKQEADLAYKKWQDSCKDFENACKNAYKNLEIACETALNNWKNSFKTFENDCNEAYKKWENTYKEVSEKWQNIFYNPYDVWINTYNDWIRICNRWKDSCKECDTAYNNWKKNCKAIYTNLENALKSLENAKKNCESVFADFEKKVKDWADIWIKIEFFKNSSSGHSEEDLGEFIDPDLSNIPSSIPNIRPQDDCNIAEYASDFDNPNEDFLGVPYE